MDIKKILVKTTSVVKTSTTTVASRYNLHVRKKAIKQVSAKLKEKHLAPSLIEPDDYEAMVSDATKDINLKYAKKSAQAGFALFGFDFILGL